MKKDKPSACGTVGSILFLMSAAAAAADISCYTVQLAAMPVERQASEFLREQQLEDRCRVVSVPGNYTVRCSPERSYLLAMRHLERFREAYPSAYVNVTKRYFMEASFVIPDGDHSTCAPGLNEFDTVLFPDSFIAIESETDGSISNILGRIENVRDKYLEKLNERGSFKGFYFRSQFERDMDNSDEREFLALEWELFDEGWRESKKQLDEKRVETKLQYLQLLRDMHERNLHEALFRFQGVSNSTRFYQAKKRFKTLKNLLAKYEEQLEQGYVTRTEYENMRYKYERAQHDVHHYSGLDRRRMRLRDFDIVNTIEYVSLAPFDSLTDKAVDNSYDLRIQELFISRSESFPEWLDNLSLRLYVGTEREFGADELTNIVGIRARIPIGSNHGRQELIDIEQSAYRDQQQAIIARLEQKINRLSELFQFHQKRIKTAASEYRLLERHRDLQREYREHPLPALAAVPDKAIDHLTVDLLAKEEDILLARLDAYEVLLQLEALVIPDVLSELVVN